MAVSDLSLNELRDAADLAVAVGAAVETGIFAGLAAGPGTAEELARRMGLSPRGVAILLPVLAELRLVEERDGAFALTAAGREQLADRASPRYIGGGVALWFETLRAWTRMPETLRTGEPALEHGPAADRGDAIARFMAGMATRPAAKVRATIELALARRPDARTALDLGGGPGLYARALLDAGLEEVTLFDLPDTVAYVSDVYGLDDVPGLRLAAGDFLENPLPTGPYDLVLVSNILHMLSPEQSVLLLRKAHDALAPGGVVVIGDMVRGRSPRAARFALTMLLRTRGGNTYTEDEYREWLREAGFHDIRLDDVDADIQVITGVRA